MKKIIFTTDNGNCAVMTPNLDCGLTIEEIAKKDVPDGKQYWIIDESELPAPCDDECFNAWEIKAGKVVVNQEKADAIRTANAMPSHEEMQTMVIEALTKRIEALECAG